MPVTVVVGAQWGDEGKGKVVDVLSQEAEVVVRYSGGANAGHTLVVEGETTIVHLLPSGILHPHTTCVLGAGMVIDPATLLEEMNAVGRLRGLDPSALLISERAHVVMPHHRMIDSLREEGVGALGTTRRGIGPAYEDKSARRGLRIADLMDTATLNRRVEANLAGWEPVIRALGGQPPERYRVIDELWRLGDELKPFVGDAMTVLRNARRKNKAILLEGAQGTLLDLDHGTYPYVTSSSVTAAGACAGAGLGPTHIDRVVGIAKAYTTRVGLGPFPTELDTAEAESLRKAGSEFGATTGRARRCGWLDAAALRYASELNGFSELVLTKLDVLSGLESIQIGVAYNDPSGERVELPPCNGLARVRPVYETFPGWNDDLTQCRSRDQLPEAARNYVQRIEELVGCPVTMISVGAEREQIIR